MFVSDELIMTRTEVVVAYFNVLSQGMRNITLKHE